MRRIAPPLILPFLFCARVRATPEGLTKEQIQGTIEKNISQVLWCYEEGLKKSPKLTGTVRTKIEISGTGAVANAAIETSNLNNSEVEACMLAKIKRWNFPAPLGGVTVHTSYPFLLKKLKTKEH